eukprot:gene3310-3795_t
MASLVSQNCEKQVQHLIFGAYELMSLHLRPKRLGKDWRSLADLLDFSREEIDWMDEESDPVLTLLNRWIARDGSLATTSKLVECLQQLKRYDTVKDLQEFIDKTPTPEEYLEIKTDLQKKEKERLETSPSTMHERYDVFISFAEADIDFAKHVVKTLEAEKYNIKACISFRDFLPGAHTLEQIAEAIEDRCSKVIAILSSDYVNCEKCDHQAKVALSLSPGCRSKRLLPVLYKKCDIPRIMKSIFYLDYTDEDLRDIFWDRLHKAIIS